MKISDLSIRRPVLASMLSLALVLFGAIGYTELSVREFPDVDPPIVSVTTALPGANPQVVESAVTDILEEELSTVEGLRTLTSSSAEGTRNVEVPAGRIESERREFTVRSLGELKTPEEFGNLVVSNNNGILVKLKDLGRVELGAEDERSALRFRGTPAVAIGVIRQSKANILSVADEIRSELP